MNRFDGFQFVLPSLAHLQEINQVLDEETERRRTRNRRRRHALQNHLFHGMKVCYLRFHCYFLQITFVL
jgi:hypothetical protein